jgi:hypothetical protein
MFILKLLIIQFGSFISLLAPMKSEESPAKLTRTELHNAPYEKPSWIDSTFEDLAERVGSRVEQKLAGKLDVLGSDFKELKEQQYNFYSRAGLHQD